MLLNVINIIYVLTILLIIRKYYKYNGIIFLLLLLHLLSVFIFNGFLFEPSLMPDQFRYTDVAAKIRVFNFSDIDETSLTVLFTGFLFSLFPIPFISNLYSIGIINYLLYIFIFIFAIKKKIFNNNFSIYFYLLFPSLLLYSSLALRDMLVFVVMFLGIYYLLKHKYVLALSILSILVIIKFQNLLVILVVFGVVFLFYFRGRIDVGLLVLLVLCVFLYNYEAYFSLEMLNKYRHSFYNENIKDITSPFIPLSSYNDLVIKIIPDTINFILRPLPWKENSLLQILQFMENVIVLLISLFIVYKNKILNLYRINEVIFLNAFFFLGIIIYALVSYNSGTAVRYKFPFVTIYILYSFYYISYYSSNSILLEKEKKNQ